MQYDSSLHGGAVAGDPAPGGSGLTIGEVSTLLGLPAPIIRLWERSNGLPLGTRDKQGRRRYSMDDVAVLRRMHEQRAAGSGASWAVAAATGASPLALCRLLLAGVDLLDGEKITAVLDASLNGHGLPMTLDEVLLPSMREMGARWSRGECDVAQEHLATGTVLAWLAGRMVAAPAPLHDGSIVLACGPHDQHTVALEAFHLLLRQQRFDCRNLGARTPAASLQLAVEQCSAQAVVLVCQLPRNRPVAASALEAVSQSGAALFYAGAAFRTAAARQKMPGHYLGGNLSRAAARITTQLRPG